MKDKLRKAAQAVVDTDYALNYQELSNEDRITLLDGYNKEMQALREALQAEPEKPVACILTKDGIPLDTWLEDDVIAQIQCGGYRRDDYIVVPLYTAPPSIDALISEIDAETPYSSFYAERIKGILNKYKPESITLNAL